MKSADCALLIVGENGHLADGNQGLFMLNRISFRRRQQKCRKPGNIMSRLSNRVWMRLQPLSLRNNRSTSFRSLQSSRAQSRSTFRFAFGGTAGIIPKVSTSRRILSPSQARSIAGGAFRPDGPSFPAGRGLRARRGHAPGTNSQPPDWGILLQRFRGVFT